MATIFLARHGETVWHHENRYTGISDIGMTSRGYEQAEALGAWAAGAHLSRLVSSNLSRAIKTAEAAQKHTGLELDLEPGLREVDFGRAEGMTLGEMREAFPDDLQAFLEKPGEVPLPDGEPGTDALRRVHEALHAIACHDNAARVLVVTHSTVMRLLLCQILGININNYRSVFSHVANAAVTELRSEPATGAMTRTRWRVAGFNVPPVVQQ